MNIGNKGEEKYPFIIGNSPIPKITAGSGAVDSWNTRIGDVVPVAGDYNASQVADDSSGIGPFVDDTLTDHETRLLSIEGKEVKLEIFEAISANTGTVTLPTGATVILDEYEDAGDCLITKLDSNGRPIGEQAEEADGTKITATFDLSGNFVLSGAPSAYPVGLIYIITISLDDIDNVPDGDILASSEFTSSDRVQNESTVTGGDVTEALDTLETEKTKWVFPYIVGDYPANTMTRIGDWTAISNKDTSDYPVPQYSGEEFNVYDGDMGTSQDLARQVIFGTRYVADIGAYVKGYRIYTIAGNKYDLYSVEDPLGDKIFDFKLQFTATQNGWVDISIAPTLVQPGSSFDIVAIVQEPDPTPTIFSGDWDYQTPTNETVPVAGNITHSSKVLNKIRVSYLDDTTTDRETELQSLVVGDIIRTPELDWAIQASIDQGTYIEFDIAPSTQLTTTGIKTFEFETKVETPITFGFDQDYYLGNANVDGLFAEDDSYDNIIVNDNAYGIDILVQEVVQSEDWDIVASSANIGGSERVSVENVYQVAKSGGQYTNPVDALNAVMSPSSTNRYCIQVAPGVYDIDNTAGPVALKDFVDITSCGRRPVTFIPADPTQDMFTGANFCSITGIIFSGGTGASWVLRHEVAGNVGITNCVLRDYSNGFLCNNASSVLECREIIINNPGGTTTDTGIRYSAGTGTVKDITARSTSKVNTVLDVLNTGTVVSVVDIVSISPNTQVLLKVMDGCLVSGSVVNGLGIVDGIILSGDNTIARLTDVKLVNCQNDGFRIENVGANIDFSLYSGIVSGAGNLNFNILNPNCIVTGTGFTELRKSYKIPGAGLYASLIDITEDDEGVNTFGEQHTGSIEKGAETCKGGGDSTSKGMLVYSETPGGVFTDRSEDAGSASGSTFTFDGTAVDNSIYVGSSIFSEDTSDYFKHPGIKVKVVTAAVIGSGEIVTEYWNGSIWTEFTTSVRGSGGKYLPYAKQYFELAGSFQYRYNGYIPEDTWTKNDPMGLGENYYWIRFRIATAITTAPVLEQFKTHSNHGEDNADGFPEYMGKARPFGKLDWSVTQFQPAGTNLADNDVYFSDTIDIGGDENYFNAIGDRSGSKSTAPPDMDTSTPIQFDFCLRADTVGVVNYTIRWTYAEPGSAVYDTSGGAPVTHPNQQSITGTVTVDSADTLVWIREYLDFSGAITRRENGFADILAYTIERETGSVVFAAVEVDAKYLKWSNGGHI